MLSEINNKIQTVVTGNGKDGTLTIHQDAAISLGKIDAGSSVIYKNQYNSNGVYIFNLEGELKIADEKLSKRDAIGLWEVDEIEINAEKESRFVIVEVPMS